MNPNKDRKYAKIQKRIRKNLLNMSEQQKQKELLEIEKKLKTESEKSEKYSAGYEKTNQNLNKLIKENNYSKEDTFEIGMVKNSEVDLYNGFCGCVYEIKRLKNRKADLLRYGAKGV